MTDLRNPIFNNYNAALRHLEKIRWPDCPTCLYCGNAAP